MNLVLKVWRQKNAGTPGQFETFEAKDVSVEGCRELGCEDGLEDGRDSEKAYERE